MAPQKKKAPTPGYCRWCCSCCCTGFSIWAICFGLSWPAALDLKLQTAIYEGGIKNKADKDYTGITETNRKANHVDVNLKYYFFNITNPIGVQNGDAPKLVKMGPYVFQKYVTEHHIEYFNDKKMRRGRKVGELVYMPGFSCDTCRLTDMIINPAHVLSAWATWKCPGVGDKENSEVHAWCKAKIAKFGLFEPHSVEQQIYGYKEWGGVVLRINNGHHVCPIELETCRDPAVTKFYTGTAGAGSWVNYGVGQYGANLDGRRMNEAIQLTGYDNEGCMLPYEYKRHGITCPKGIQLGRSKKKWGSSAKDKSGYGPHSPPAVNVDDKGEPGPGFSYEKHKKDVAAKTCTVWKDKDGNCTDSYDDWIKATTSNFYQYYDSTPYDTSDDKDLDWGFKMDDDTKPCKWDGSTNNIAGCPHMEEERSFVIGHGIFNPLRTNKDNPSLPHFGILEKRNLELKFVGNNLVHGIKGKKYTIDEKHYKSSFENAKYGMAPGAAWENFPGDGVMPLPASMSTVALPVTMLTRPHWYGGGAQAIKWNRDQGLRTPTATSDAWSITYEPVTGLPIHGSLQWQFNTMYKPVGINIHEGNLTTPVAFNFSDLTLSAGAYSGEKINLNKLGAWRGCGGWQGTEGCPMMVPYWILKLELNFSPFIAEKIKRLLNILKTVGLLKFIMRFWAWGGITGIVCVGGCLAYHYFGSGKKR